MAPCTPRGEQTHCRRHRPPHRCQRRSHRPARAPRAPTPLPARSPPARPRSARPSSRGWRAPGRRSHPSATVAASLLPPAPAGSRGPRCAASRATLAGGRASSGAGLRQRCPGATRRRSCPLSCGTPCRPAPPSASLALRRTGTPWRTGPRPRARRAHPRARTCAPPSAWRDRGRQRQRWCASGRTWPAGPRDGAALRPQRASVAGQHWLRCPPPCRTHPGCRARPAGTGRRSKPARYPGPAVRPAACWSCTNRAVCLRTAALPVHARRRRWSSRRPGARRVRQGRRPAAALRPKPRAAPAGWPTRQRRACRCLAGLQGCCARPQPPPRVAPTMLAPQRAETQARRRRRMGRSRRQPSAGGPGQRRLSKVLRASPPRHRQGRADPRRARGVPPRLHPAGGAPQPS
mmetsp:Transcript_56771/g.182359  ORF Transcript_56771/g.182359 Transcript_56771/m.182359 type:complete len:405 (+) Transcript_56771:135-1349(+)